MLCANCIVPETNHQPLTLDGTASTPTPTVEERMFKKDNSIEYMEHGYKISFFALFPPKNRERKVVTFSFFSVKEYE